MALLPPRDGTINRIYDSYVEKQRVAPPRTHLGASEIGRECERQIWYSFRWVRDSFFSGRMLRLFDTGKLEENRLVADLNAVGVEVRPFDLKTGRQYRMEMFGGHFGGSLDGVCLGLIEAPKTWHILEMKTHNDKSFKDLVSKGVKESKPEHWWQMQSYMGMSHETPLPEIPPITRAFYFAVNKNTDDLYSERIEYDGAAFLSLQEKAKRSIFAQNPPVKISNKKDFYKCNFCNFKDLCHGTPTEWVKPQKSCRTCIHATPYDDGTWRCSHWNKVLAPEEQRAGCEKHLFIPKLLPFKQVDATENSVVYDDSNGNVVTNYEGGEIV